MKKILLTLPILLLASLQCSAASYPEIPDTGREHYIIYREGYRDNRVELAQFDIDGEDELVLNENILSSKNENEYKNDIKYYLNGDEWVQFEEGYERVSNNAAQVIESDIDVYDNNGKIRLYGQNEDGSLKDYPELKKDWNNITSQTISADEYTFFSLSRHENALITDEAWEKHNSKVHTPDDIKTGHFLDIANDPYPDEQRRYSFKDGYAILPTYSKDNFQNQTSEDAPMPELMTADDYGNIYLTDYDYNITGIIKPNIQDFTLNDRGYFICVDSLQTAGGEWFAMVKIMRKYDRGFYFEYQTELAGPYLINNGKVEMTMSFGEDMRFLDVISPNGKLVFAYKYDPGYNHYTTEYAIADGKTYVLHSDSIDYKRYYAKMIGDYFVKTNITSMADLQPDGNSENHNYGIIKELYFSRDYINYVSLPLKEGIPDSELLEPVIKKLDDQYYALFYTDRDKTYFNAYPDKRPSQRPVQIFSTKMLTDMVASLPDPVYVAYNDMLLSFDTPPQIIDGRTMIPIRLLFETMGASVSWDDTTKTARIRNGGTEIEITADSETAVVNGEEKTMDVGARIIDGRTLVPLRFLSESLGYTVTWNDEYRLVTVDN